MGGFGGDSPSTPKPGKPGKNGHKMGAPVNRGASYNESGQIGKAFWDKQIKKLYFFDTGHGQFLGCFSGLRPHQKYTQNLFYSVEQADLSAQIAIAKKDQDRIWAHVVGL